MTDLSGANIGFHSNSRDGRVILSVHDVKNESINEQKCAALARCANSILYLYKKIAERMNISLLHMYGVYLPSYQNCIDNVVLISLNVMWNIRNEVDKTFVRTK